MTSEPSASRNRLVLIVYTAAIFVSAADGSGLRRVTDASANVTPDLSSAQWTADGAAIWFRSTRSGAVQIWRIGADGGGLMQVTNGEQSIDAIFKSFADSD